MPIDFENAVEEWKRNSLRINEMPCAFSAIAMGQSGVPERPPLRDATPAAYFGEDGAVLAFHAECKKRIGHFGTHTVSSIPYVLEEWCRLGTAISAYLLRLGQRHLRPTAFHSIGSAEGVLARSIAAIGNGAIYTLANSSTPENSIDFHAFGAPDTAFFLGRPYWEIDPQSLKENPGLAVFSEGMDIILEDTSFQMHMPNRTEQVAWACRNLKPNGLFISIEKCGLDDAEEYARRERQKDEQFKSAYFAARQISEKRNAILNHMEGAQVRLDTLIAGIGATLAHACITWNSGNFYTVVASNDPDELQAFCRIMLPPCLPAEFQYMTLPQTAYGTALPLSFRRPIPSSTSTSTTAARAPSEPCAADCDREITATPADDTTPNVWLTVGLPTLIGVAPMLGHRFDDVYGVCAKGQDRDMVQRFATASECPVPDGHIDHFYATAMDVMAHRRNGQRYFGFLELNGAGFGGITSLPDDYADRILATFEDIGKNVCGTSPVVIVSSSRHGAPGSRAPHHQLHDRILRVDRIAKALHTRYGDVEVLSLESLIADGWRGRPRPAVVFGYNLDFTDQIVVKKGAPELIGRAVSAIVNDRLVQNIEALHGDLDNTAFVAANRCYRAGADKSEAYRLNNSFDAFDQFPVMSGPIRFDIARTKEAIFDIVSARLAKHERLVIKPMGTGHADGIAFFLGGETAAQIREQIDRSLTTVRAGYGDTAGLPYAVTEFFDAECIDAPNNAFHGCKYEMRIVVFREGNVLRAIPSAIKVASEQWDALSPSGAALLTNVSIAASLTGKSKSDYSRPLCSAATLALIQMNETDVAELCRWATAYVSHILRTLPPKR